MADLGINFLRRKHTIHWYQSLFTVITVSMPFRYFWATLYSTHHPHKKKSPLRHTYVFLGLPEDLSFSCLGPRSITPSAWEPEGCSKMFHWVPYTLLCSDSALLVLKGTSLNNVNALLTLSQQHHHFPYVLNYPPCTCQTHLNLSSVSFSLNRFQLFCPSYILISDPDNPRLVAVIELISNLNISSNEWGKCLYLRLLLSYFQSGVSVSLRAWMPLETAADIHRDFAQSVGCPVESQAMVDCMRGIDAEDLQRQQGRVWRQPL